MSRPPMPSGAWTPLNAPVYIPSMKNPLPSAPDTPRGGAEGDFVRKPQSAAAGTGGHPPSTAPGTLRASAGGEFVRTQHDAATGTGEQHPPIAAPRAPRGAVEGDFVRMRQKRPPEPGET